MEMIHQLFQIFFQEIEQISEFWRVIIISSDTFAQQTIFLGCFENVPPSDFLLTRNLNENLKSKTLYVIEFMIFHIIINFCSISIPFKKVMIN